MSDALCTTLYRILHERMSDMNEVEVVTDHEAKSEQARSFLSQEFRDLINAIKDQMDDDRGSVTAGMIAVLVSALKGYGDLYQVRERPGASGKLTELQVSRLIQAAVSEERARVLEEVKAARQESVTRAGGDVREALRALSEKSLG